MKYKVNLRKIFALIVSVALVISVFAVLVVSADDETGMTNQEYYASQSYLIAKYKDGKISYSEFQQQSQAVTDEFVSKNTVGGVLQSGALNASNTFNAVSQKIGDTVQKYGDSARDYLSSIVSNFFDDYTVLNDKPTTDLNGSGALFEWYNPSGYLMKRAYCEYIIRDSSGDFRCYGDIRDINYNPNGTIQSEYKYPYGGTGKYYSWTSMPEYQKFYGDVRYEDGTQAPTDDTFETITDYDFTQATEKELEDLIKDLLNEFELQMPDLSSIEGLLNAIYARLGTLDSDDDASTLSLINSAINTLVAENKDSNDKIIEKLENLKLESDNQAILDKLNEIFPAYDYDIDMSRTEELKLLFLTKWAFVEELKTLIDRFMSSYEQKSSLGTMDNVIHVKYNPTNGSFGNVILNHNGAYDIRFDIFEPYLPAIRGLIAAFIYLSYAFNTYRKIPSYIRGGDTS